MRHMSRRKFLGVAGVGLVSARLLGVTSQSAVAATTKKYKIALSNSYIGNKWRIEMENVFKAALEMEPFKSQVDGSWFNSGNDVSKQSQQISNLIAERADAILIDAASPTGLNGIITQATQRGILVVAFDNIVTAPSALNVETDELEFGRMGAEWLVKKLDGKGNIIMVTGVAGTHDDTDRNAGADQVWGQHPDIKVVARYTGMWDSAIAERNTAAVLPSLPKIDGIWCSAGTDGVLKAFVGANRTPLPPTAGEGENGFRKFMTGYMDQKVEGISITEPPYESVIALELARRILEGSYPKKNIVIPFPFVTSDTVKVGETVFPDLPDSFFSDFTDNGPQATVKICIDAALEGKACPGALSVNLPNA
jgi:ribose transport system substrate-binding protein